MPIGRGNYFHVYRHIVTPVDYQSMWLSITSRREASFSTPVLQPGTHVAIKRMVVKDRFGKVDISEPGQLYATCQEILVLLHPELREHDCIIKLQAIIWEKGLAGDGIEGGEPLWPSLVMEFCETTLAEYQSHNTLTSLQGAVIGSKIGEGLDTLHSVNIFHGDLKAENVLLKIRKNGDLEPKLADFGCSVRFEDEEGRTKYYITGTPLWCAPECPGEFTSMEEIEATDLYSMALLFLQMWMNGKNPFEELEVIPEHWTYEERMLAVQTLKEDDCIPALLFGNRPFESLAPPERFIANALIANPQKRMTALNDMNLEADIDLTIKRMQSLEFDSPERELEVEMARKYIEETAHQYSLKNSNLNPNSSIETEYQPDELDPMSFVASFSGENNIPDLVALSKSEHSIALNSSMRVRIVGEIATRLIREGVYPAAQRCAKCCQLTVIDSPIENLGPDQLLQEVQHQIQIPLLDHTCVGSQISDISSEHQSLSGTLLGELRSSEIDRKWKLLWQLFLATATGFGVQQDETRALDILEQGCTSGFAASHLYCRYAAYTKQSIDPNLPVRSWLVRMVLFSAGIPSDAFTALQNIDLHLSKVTSIARSLVYNGSTAAFENYRFITQYPLLNFKFEIKPGYVSDFSIDERGLVVQNESFNNTLLHLAAGSYGPELTLISYCVEILDIDIDVRNASGATPLLLACRAGREEKISLLLMLGANVNAKFDTGETPLHWLGLLPDSSRVLDEFIKRGADINAQVSSAKYLPNFIGGSQMFYSAGGPLVWAMAMQNEAYFDALLERGADIHYSGPSGATPIRMACRPRFSRFLPRLSRENSFMVTLEDAYCIIARWSSWMEMKRIVLSVEPAEQEEALKIVLGAVGLFDDLGDVYTFFNHLVSHAVCDSRLHILEIIFSALSRSVELVRNQELDHGIYVKSPFSHTLWRRHRYIHDAARRGDSEILIAVLKMYPSKSTTSVDDFGWTPLHTLSAHSDNPKCVDVLMSYGALEVLDARLPGWGLSAFMNALSCCNFRVADRILSYVPTDQQSGLLLTRAALRLPIPGLSLVGHFVAWSPCFGKAPLEYLFGLPEFHEDLESAFMGDETEKMTLLMVAAGFINEGSIYDLELFATARRNESYKFLLAKFPTTDHLNAKDKEGSTALHIATWTGNSDFATLLMERGADINAKDNSGYTPLDGVFRQNPPFLDEDKEEKKVIITRFKEFRHIIYKKLKDKGAKYGVRAIDPERQTTDVPIRES